MTGQPARARGSRDWLLLVMLAACFCGAFFFTRVALAELPPVTIVLGRVGLGAAALHLALRLRGERMPLGWAHWRAFLVTGALGNSLPFALTVFGETRIASGLASILIATTPLCMIVVAHLLTRDEKLGRNRLVGVLIGFAGAVVVIGPMALVGSGGDRGTLAGQLAVLGATVCYALAGVYGRRFRALPPLTSAPGQLTAATLWLLPVALLVDQPWTRGLPGSEAVGALLLGTTLLGERIEPRQVLGMAVIFLGLASVDGSLRTPRLVTSGAA